MGGSWLNNIRAQKSEKLENDPYLQLIMAECLLHPLFFTVFLDISTVEENAELAEVIEETEKVNFWNMSCSFPRRLTTSVFDYSVSSGMEIVGFNFGRNSAHFISLLRGILRNSYIKVKGPSNNVGLSS